MVIAHACIPTADGKGVQNGILIPNWISLKEIMEYLYGSGKTGLVDTAAYHCTLVSSDLLPLSLFLVIGKYSPPSILDLPYAPSRCGAFGIQIKSGSITTFQHVLHICYGRFPGVSFDDLRLSVHGTWIRIRSCRMQTDF